MHIEESWQSAEFYANKVTMPLRAVHFEFYKLYSSIWVHHRMKVFGGQKSAESCVSEQSSDE